MKPHYSEFVRHCLRYYVLTLDEGKGDHPVFKSNAEKENWRACYTVLKDYSEGDMEIISHLYRPGDTVPDKIHQLSALKRIPQDTIWHLVSTTERKVAQKRGLI